ncbi:MAG: hypothetical protein CMB99_09210 [Flavobacteriaceae bacterium]|nr:hypothetical protein [Flavobacteriaceae bacterium]|tara:strand:+ start:494887 stop:496215 length:1329 start_codon:yes stop_codon:yes gene_type:complete
MTRKALFIVIFMTVLSCRNEDLHLFDNFSRFGITKVQTNGGSLNDGYQSIVSTNDGGYALLGFTQSNDFDIQTKSDISYDFWLSRYASDHTLQWSKTYGGSGDDRGSDIVATSDGGFAILGFSTSSDGDVRTNNGIRDFWVMKTDAQGSIQWQETFGFSGSDYGVSLIETKDNGLLLAGVLDVTASGGQGNSKSASRHAGGDFWVIKLAQDGTKEWTRYFGGSFTDTPFGVIETDDNQFIVAGSSDSDDVDISNNKGSYDFWVTAIDQNGNLVWERNFGGSEIDEARGITKASDGNLVIIGDTRSTNQDITINNGAADLWMIKIDTSGNLLWQKSVGGASFDAGRSISNALNNGFIISGSTRSTNAQIKNEGQNDAWILGLNDQGDILWQHTIGGSEIDVFYDAIQLNDQTILAVGDSRSNNADILNNKGFTDGLIATLKNQ